MRSKSLSFLLIILISTISSPSQENAVRDKSHPAYEERKTERATMVDRDIKNYPHHPVRDPGVLEAMRIIPRHYFVPPHYRKSAYHNNPLVIGHNQTISQPFIVAHMTELLELSHDHKVLEIGTGSGYQAAVLGELCDDVYTIEIIPPLGRQAQERLKQLGYSNVHVKIGDGYEGWAEFAPFDRILVTCAPYDIPQPLIDQLATGGRIVIPVGKANQTQYIVVVTKDKKGHLTRSKQLPVRFVPMTGKALQ